MFNSQLRKQLGNTTGAVRQAFRAVLTGNKSTTPTQLSSLDALAGESLDAIELMQHFGFTSNPPADTDVVVLPLGGKTTHGVIIATENGSYRVTGLPTGATAIYDQSGTRIVLNNDGTVDVYADKTTYHGDIHCTGKITSDGDQIAGGVSQIHHTHSGVKSGSSSTGEPN